MILRCYVDDETLRLLRLAAAELGRTVEALAEDAIANAAIEYKRTLREATPLWRAEQP